MFLFVFLKAKLTQRELIKKGSGFNTAMPLTRAQIVIKSLQKQFYLSTVH